MQKSSETIGAIAAALARAQTKLKNPEKTLTASIAHQTLEKASAPFNMPRSQAD